MTTISITSTTSISETRTEDGPLKTIVLFCCVGLIASFCRITFGIDLGANWV
jgi:hypothetical protein